MSTHKKDGMRQVLVIEDDRNIIDLLEIHLQDIACQVTRSTDGLSGLEMAKKEAFDLIILDLMLPMMDGLEVCRQLRQWQLHTPILVLSAKSEEIDKVLALETGADDYMTKPFSVREFIARVKAIFRRNTLLQTEQATTQQKLEFGALCIDVENRKVSLEGQRIDLSPKEFELLIVLASHPGKSYDRKRLLRLIWGYDFDGFEHTVNSHINRLRQKIEPQPAEPRYILTTWGVGYRFNEEIK